MPASSDKYFSDIGLSTSPCKDYKTEKEKLQERLSRLTAAMCYPEDYVERKDSDKEEEEVETDAAYVIPLQDEKTQAGNKLGVCLGMKLSADDVLKVLKFAYQRIRPILIFVEEVDDHLQLVLYHLKIVTPMWVCPVKVPGFGEDRASIMHDLAIITGGQVINEEFGCESDVYDKCFDVLGSCRWVIVTEDETILLEGDGDVTLVEESCKQIKSALQLSTSDYEKEKFCRKGLIGLLMRYIIKKWRIMEKEMIVREKMKTL